MKPVVLDSTVLIGFCDPDNAAHERVRKVVTEFMAAGHKLVVPVSVLSEVLVGAYRSTPHAVRVVEGFVDDLVHDVRTIDRPIGRAAAKYRADHPEMRLPVALVFGTAKVLNAEQILTTEPSWQEIDRRVLVVR